MRAGADNRDIAILPHLRIEGDRQVIDEIWLAWPTLWHRRRSGIRPKIRALIAHLAATPWRARGEPSGADNASIMFAHHTFLALHDCRTRGSIRF